VLGLPFAPEVGDDGELTPDQFHHQIACEACRRSMSTFVDDLVAAVHALPGAFATPAVFDNAAFYTRLKELMVWASTQYASAYEVVLAHVQREADRDADTLRQLCRQQLKLLAEFRQILTERDALFFGHDAFERLVTDPPTQFSASLADRGVFLQDLLQVLPGFVLPNVAPVSVRTWQLAATNFVCEHHDALVAATADATAALRRIVRLGDEAPELEAVQVVDGAQRDGVRCALPAHQHPAGAAVHVVAGADSRLGAAIPSFRVLAALKTLCQSRRLVPSAMCAHAFMPLVYRALAESDRWRFSPTALPAPPAAPPAPAPAPATTPAATPPPTPVPTRTATPAASSVAASSAPGSPAPLASGGGGGGGAALSALTIVTGTAALLRKAIDDKLERIGPPTVLYAIAFSHIAEQLKATCGGADRPASLLQKVSRVLRNLAAAAGVEVGKNKERKLSLLGTRVKLERLRAVAAGEA